MNGAVQIHGEELLRVQVKGKSKNLVVLRNDGSVRLFDAHPLVEGFNAEHGTKLTVVSPKVADVAFTVGETWRSLPACVVDAAIAYETPGTKLGKEVIFAAEGEPRVVLATGKYKGERDVALVALGVTSADFKRDGNSTVLDIPETRLIVVPDFPASSGSYRRHTKTGVPHGREEYGKTARPLERLDSSYVGLAAYGFHTYDDYFDGHHYYESGCYAYVDLGASGRLGVVAEVPDEDAAKIEALIGKPPAAKTDEKAVIEVPGVSRARLSDLCWEATRAVGGMRGIVDEQLLAPVREFLAAIGRTRLD